MTRLLSTLILLLAMGAFLTGCYPGQTALKKSASSTTLAVSSVALPQPTEAAWMDGSAPLPSAPVPSIQANWLVSPTEVPNPVPATPTIGLGWNCNYNGMTNVTTTIYMSEYLSWPLTNWFSVFSGQTNQCRLPMLLPQEFFIAGNSIITNT